MNNLIKIDSKLKPLSWLYGFAVGIRNELFNLNILKSKEFDIPIIGVGNITVGGTGKTPCVEYLIRLLQDNCKLAVLSRGYKRKSKGFVLAKNEDYGTSSTEIGDEPYQLKTKFPNVIVAVDEERVDGIEKLLSLPEKPDLIILDDCYQHRYVKPGLNILLIDYNRMISDDYLLPAGRLREPAYNRDRADVIIVTKCPANMKPIEFRVLTKTVNAYPYQKLFFSTIAYGNLRKVFSDSPEIVLDSLEETNVLLLTGIATPEQLHDSLTTYTKKLHPLAFPDHHEFTDEDVKKINSAFASISEPKLIVTTEKDETRLKSLFGLSDEVKEKMYVLPIMMEIINENKEKFQKVIADYSCINIQPTVQNKRDTLDTLQSAISEEVKPKIISFDNY